jgi:uncharacterized protein
MNSEYHVTNNKTNLQFEIEAQGDIASLAYRWYKGDLALMHTHVPNILEGKGAGSSLAKYALEYARANKIKVMVYCPFVSSYLKKHPEYMDVVDKKYTQ